MRPLSFSRAATSFHVKSRRPTVSLRYRMIGNYSPFLNKHSLPFSYSLPLPLSFSSSTTLLFSSSGETDNNNNNNNNNNNKVDNEMDEWIKATLQSIIELRQISTYDTATSDDDNNNKAKTSKQATTKYKILQIQGPNNNSNNNKDDEGDSLSKIIFNQFHDFDLSESGELEITSSSSLYDDFIISDPKMNDDHNNDNNNNNNNNKGQIHILFPNSNPKLDKNNANNHQYDLIVIDPALDTLQDDDTATDNLLWTLSKSLKPNGIACFQMQSSYSNNNNNNNDISSKQCIQMLLQYPLSMLHLSPNLSTLSVQKVNHISLKTWIGLRGKVDMGYGRGGKQLGFPTANLPSSLFINALECVPAGVYFGWALIESNDNDESPPKGGRDILQKAVVNIGYSPTFEGKENREKIVEAHLIMNDNDHNDDDDDDDSEKTTRIEGDFYGETMKLALMGFIRPEQKFASFPELIMAITNDCQIAKKALTMEPNVLLKQHNFFALYNDDDDDDDAENNNNNKKKKSVWIGQNGGNEDASWEFESMYDTISKIL